MSSSTKVFKFCRTMSLVCTRYNWLKAGLVVLFLLINVVLYRECRDILYQTFNYGNKVALLGLANNQTTRIFLLNGTANRTPVKSLNITAPLTPTRSQTSSQSDRPTLPSLPVLTADDAKRLQSLLAEDVVNPHNFQYVIQPKAICSNRVVQLVICVPVSRKNFLGRETVRETWGSYAYNKSNNAILIFFIGSSQSDNESEQRRIEKEAEKYGDIFQEDYIDTYGNLSVKSASILKWISTFCPNTQFVLKADDDMYVNIPNMMKSLKKLVPDPSHPGAFAVGNVIVNAAPIRSNTSKWFTSELMYKHKKYPKYLSGTAYAMNSQAAVLLYQASLRVPLFWLEDIYITGLCSQKAGVTLHWNPLFTYNKPKASGCTFRTQITGHRYTIAEIHRIHSELYSGNLTC